MTVVTIKKVERRTSFSRKRAAHLAASAIATFGKPKTVVVKVKSVGKKENKQNLTPSR